MFSLWDHVDPNKRDISVIGMKNLMDQLNISYSTCYRWCKKGMPHYKVKGSKKILFNWDKVQEWLEGQSGIPKKHTRYP
jgi:excisionase family DNA binding protein